jgi:hypothetical protein
MELIWRHFYVSLKANLYLRSAIFLGLQDFDACLHLRIMERLFFLNSIIHSLSHDVNPILRRELLKYICTFNVAEYSNLIITCFEALSVEPLNFSESIFMPTNGANLQKV